MKIAISAESTVDLDKNQREKFNIHTVPFTVILGDRVGEDGEITCDEIIDFVSKNNILPKTSAVNVEQYNDHFKKLKEEYDAVIHFCLSSKLSSAYNNAVESAKNFENVFVIDSLSLSSGIALLAIYASKLVEQGKTPQEIVEKCLQRRGSDQTSFVLRRLDYLYRGGRCSALSYFGANILKIRPQIIVKEGKMVVGKKFRGNFDRAVENYCQDILESFNTPDLSICFVTYTTCDKETIDWAVEKMKSVGFKEVVVARANGTITSHCGENCFGILYLNDGENEL